MKKISGLRVGYSSSYKLSVILVILLFITVSLPVEAALMRQDSRQDLAQSEELLIENGEEQIPSSEKATIGTFWWYRDNGGLIYAEADATGFANALLSDGCTWPIDRNSEYNNKLNNGGKFLEDDHLEEGAGELIDDVDIAYYVGHAGPTALSIRLPFENTNDMVEFTKCRWGDDGPNKWVVLATCYAAKSWFGFSLHGSHMILGWETACDDSIYGPTFANYIKSGMTLKEAWFQTGEECQPVPAIAKVLGEALSVGNDHLKGYGDYADPSPPDDIFFVWWKHQVNGWCSKYNWIAPDNHVNSNWFMETYAYDNIDPNYVNEPEDDTYSTYNRNIQSWSEPLVLTLESPKTIRGFRILSNHGKNIDKMQLEFYNDNELKTIANVSNWEGTTWRIIDFNATQYQATIDGEIEPEVNKVMIRYHENDPVRGFNYNQVNVSEFDFWEAEDKTSNEGSSTQFNLETQLPSQNLGAMNTYSIVPNQYNAQKFTALAAKLGVAGTTQYANDYNNPDTYIIEGNDGNSLKYHTQTGVLRYSNPSEKYSTVTSEPTMPSDDEAIQIAVDFLKENGLMSDDMTEAVVTCDTQGTARKDNQEILNEWTTSKNVYIKKELDGKMLLDKTIITIGDAGQITSFDIPTRTLQLASSVPIKSSETAFSDLPNEVSESRGDLDESVDIKNVELSYRIDSLTQNTGSITPYYVFEGKYQESGEDFAAFVSAIDG